MMPGLANPMFSYIELLREASEKSASFWSTYTKFFELDHTVELMQLSLVRTKDQLESLDFLKSNPFM